jgi:cytochrome c-type protein NapC
MPRFALVAGGVLLGALATAGLDYGIYATGTDEFCNTCHANDATKEWRESVHYRNPAGFVAGCADCHLPEAFLPKMLRKARGATVEVWGHFTGVISTPEKYEARRRAMAEAEWRRLRGTHSQECRHCHRLESMTDDGKTQLGSLHRGEPVASQLCTDCHRGVGHRAP